MQSTYTIVTTKKLKTNPYELVETPEGSCYQMILPNEMVMLFDVCDYDKAFRSHKSPKEIASWNYMTSTGCVAQTYVDRNTGVNKHYYFQDHILGFDREAEEGKYIKHINGNKLDNRRMNLVIADRKDIKKIKHKTLPDGITEDSIPCYVNYDKSRGVFKITYKKLIKFSSSKGKPLKSQLKDTIEELIRLKLDKGMGELYLQKLTGVEIQENSVEKEKKEIESEETRMCMDCNKQKDIFKFYRCHRENQELKNIRCIECHKAKIKAKAQSSVDVKPTVSSKVCRICKTEKKADEFHTRAKCKGNLRSECIECFRKLVNGREDTKAKDNQKKKLKRVTDKHYKTVVNAKRSVRQYLENPVYYEKIQKYQGLTHLDCSPVFLKEWLEYPCKELDWNNKEWEIDHVIPAEAFNLDRPGDSFVYFSWINMQLLWGNENTIKKNRIHGHYIVNNIIKACRFLTKKNLWDSKGGDIRKTIEWIKNYLATFDCNFANDNSTQVLLRCISKQGLKEKKQSKPNETATIVNANDCDSSFLRKWIETQFEGNMSWKNKGILWNKKYIIPESMFCLEDETQEKICHSWMNVYPVGNSSKPIEDTLLSSIKSIKSFMMDTKTERKYGDKFADMIKWIMNAFPQIQDQVALASL